MARYFTGRNVGSKKLVAASASTFAEFIRNYIDLPVPISLTGAEYRSLKTKAEKDAVKCQAGYFVPCTFPSSPWIGRLLEHAGECNLVVLDIDELPDGTCPAAPFVESPELLKEKLSGFNFAAYKTISHTPEKPRLRVVVDASKIPVDEYVNAALTIGQMLGLSKVTRESGIAAQAMFRPTVFADTDTDEDHPVITTFYDGRAFTAADISQDLESLPGMVSGNKKTSAVKKSNDPIEDYLTFFSRTLPQITIEIAREALEAVDPDCGYHEWMEIAFALFHQFGDSFDEVEAYEAFDEWSAKGSKYAGSDETDLKWKSLNTQPTGRAPVTIRSLLKRAVEGGWDSGNAKVECFNSISKWISFECKSGPVLMAEAAARIATTPLLSDTEEEALIQMASSVLRQKFEQKVPAATFRKKVKQLKEISFADREEKKEVQIPPWARGVIYVSSVNELVRQSRKQRFTLEAFNNVYGRRLLPTAKDLQKEGKEVTQSVLNRPMFEPSDFLLHHLKCQTADDFDYDPASPQDTIIERDHKRFLNLYRRSYRESDKSLYRYAEDVFSIHITNLIKEPEYRTVIMDWMAHNIQHPGIKIRWATLLQGAEGCGKTFLAECMRVMVGDDNLKLINTASIKKGWTEWVFGAQIVAFEEIRVAGQNRHDIMNTLKEPITNDYVPVNQRGVDTRQVRNVTNYMAFTNHHDALVLTEEARRWFILKSLIQKREQILEIVSRNPKYFSQLFDMLVTHGPGLRYWFENRTISDDFAPNGPAPRTKYLSEMIFDTSNELLATLHKIWEDDEQPFVQHDIIGATSLLNALQLEGMRTVSPQYLASVLRESGFTRLDGRHTVAGERQYVWVRSDMAFDGNPLDILEARVKEKTSISDIWD